MSDELGPYERMTTEQKRQFFRDRREFAPMTDPKPLRELDALTCKWCREGWPRTLDENRGGYTHSPDFTVPGIHRCTAKGAEILALLDEELPTEADGAHYTLDADSQASPLAADERERIVALEEGLRWAMETLGNPGMFDTATPEEYGCSYCVGMAAHTADCPYAKALALLNTPSSGGTTK